MSDQMTLFTPPEYTENTKKAFSKGKPKLNTPVRNQVEFVNASLDDLLPEDHEVRNIWDFVCQMDLSSILDKIQSTAGDRGRAATDPKILLALWIYATAQGIGSARMLDRYCDEHIAFKWLCGGVKMNNHTIADFRANNCEEFDDLIAQFIAHLLDKNLVTLKRVSQDGCKVRANAGSSSFRRKPKLKKLLTIAKEQVKTLRAELDKDPSVCLNRQQAAKKRAAEDRKQRLDQAIKEHTKVTNNLYLAKKKQRKILYEEEKKEFRSSTTDPEARKMKMGNGGFNPAFNMQIAIDTQSRFIVSYYATNKGNDFGELAKMFSKIQNKYGKTPQQYLIDQGYLLHKDIIAVQRQNCKVFVNPSKVGNKNAFEAKVGEDQELAEWRRRMGRDESKEIYKDRAATSEWANAGMRNRGLKQLFVRGIQKVNSMLGLHVLTHNVLRAVKLGYSY
jgi:transposase